MSIPADERRRIGQFAQRANGVFEGPLGPEGDFDRLFMVGGRRAALVAVQGDVDDPEADLRLDPSRAKSNPVTLGEPELALTEKNCLLSEVPTFIRYIAPPTKPDKNHTIQGAGVRWWVAK